MGVLNSRKYILDKKIFQIENLKNKKIAIDMMIYIIEYYNSIKNIKKRFYFWSNKILEFIKLFIKNNIYVICVYDGKNKNLKRYKKKIKTDYILNEYMEQLNNLILKQFKKNVEIVISIAEAESYCAHLIQTKQVDYVISNDSDFIFYKINFIHIIFNYNKIDGIYEYNLYIHVIKEDLLNNYVFEKIILACLLLGTDYTKKNPPEIVFEKINNNIMSIIEYFNKVNEKNNINYENCLKIFKPNSEIKLRLNYDLFKNKS